MQQTRSGQAGAALNSTTCPFHISAGEKTSDEAKNSSRMCYGKEKKKISEPVVETRSFNVAEENPDNPVGEYNIHMAVTEAREKYRNSIRPIHPRTIYHVAQTILRNKQAATELPRRFEGENEYQAWLKS